MKLINSFKYAFSGIGYCIRHERNFRIHISAALLVLLTGFFAGFDGGDFAALLSTISLVLFAEIANTAIEKAVDLFSPNYNAVAKTAKDLAAGAVLITALLAIGTAAALFINRVALLRILSSFCELPWLFAVFGTVLILCIIFIIWGGVKDIGDK